MMSRDVYLSVRFEQAMIYALHVHAAQRRKGTSVPYVAHLMAVAATVLEYGGDEDLAIAALLHDSAEDQGGEPRLRDVKERFGERVFRVVAACSDSLADTTTREDKKPWRERKEGYIAHLLSADSDVLLVSLADKVHNARSILRDLRKKDVGEAIWGRFSQPKDATLWYYRSLADVFLKRRPGQLSEELHDIVSELERG
jgi:(p)ppGpp synthase/HD superfamily hydrolase